MVCFDTVCVDVRTIVSDYYQYLPFPPLPPQCNAHMHTCMLAYTHTHTHTHTQTHIDSFRNRG